MLFLRRKLKLMARKIRRVLLFQIWYCFKLNIYSIYIVLNIYSISNELVKHLQNRLKKQLPRTRYVTSRQEWNLYILNLFKLVERINMRMYQWHGLIFQSIITGGWSKLSRSMFSRSCFKNLKLYTMRSFTRGLVLKQIHCKLCSVSYGQLVQDYALNFSTDVVKLITVFYHDILLK